MINSVRKRKKEGTEKNALQLKLYLREWQEYKEI